MMNLDQNLKNDSGLKIVKILSINQNVLEMNPWIFQYASCFPTIALFINFTSKITWSRVLIATAETSQFSPALHISSFVRENVLCFNAEEKGKCVILLKL